jgi:hypothetical protein
MRGLTSISNAMFLTLISYPINLSPQSIPAREIWGLLPPAGKFVTNSLHIKTLHG